MAVSKLLCQEFKADIQSTKNKYILCNSDKKREIIVSNIITTHMEIQNDDTWSKGVKKTNQVIALSIQTDSVQT